MDNQQVPKADSEFQKIVRKNYKKWKIRLLSGGGQKASSGGSPYKVKPDYKMGKSAPPGFGGSLEESEQLDEVIRKKGGKYCLFSKKTKRNLGCYPTRAGAVKREKQVQYFKHLKEEELRQEIQSILLEAGLWDTIKGFGSKAFEKIKSAFSSDEKDSKETETKEEIPQEPENYDIKADLALGRKELQAKFGGFQGYIKFLWNFFDENKSSLSGWTKQDSIKLINELAPKYGLEPHMVIGVMSGESGLMPVGIFSQTMTSKGNPEAAIRANSTAYGMGQIIHSTYESIKNQIGVPHYMLWIPRYGIEATILLISKLIKSRGSVEAAMNSYAGTKEGGARKIAAIEKARQQYGDSMVAESKKISIKLLYFSITFILSCNSLLLGYLFFNVFNCSCENKQILSIICGILSILDKIHSPFS